MSAQHHCPNCGIDTWRSTTIGMHQLEDEGILSDKQQWIAPQVVNNSHHICQACRNLAVIAMGINESPPHVTTGHRQVCINCGRSVLRAQSHVLRTDTERENMIRTVIREWIRETNSRLLLPCNVRNMVPRLGKTSRKSNTTCTIFT